MINAALELRYQNNTKVTIINNNDFGVGGRPERSLYRDPVHLNERGTSILASKYKKAIHRALGINHY
jgi:lysophospholipase L1-like esterase